jgi:hypothetical protein
MSALTFFNLTVLQFEVQFCVTVELKSQEEAIQSKRYQVIMHNGDNIVLDALNPYDLWLQVYYLHTEIASHDNIIEACGGEQPENITTMNDFVTWYVERFVQSGTKYISVYEIAEDEVEYFDEPECEEECEEDCEEECEEECENEFENEFEAEC